MNDSQILNIFRHQFSFQVQWRLWCNNEAARAQSTASKGSGDTRRLCDTQSQQSHNTHARREMRSSCSLLATCSGLTSTWWNPLTATWVRENKEDPSEGKVNPFHQHNVPGTRFLTWLNGYFWLNHGLFIKKDDECPLPLSRMTGTTLMVYL